MKAEHKQILSKIEDYLNQPGSEYLRFWQAMRNMDLIVYNDVDTHMHIERQVIDDYNISDEKLLKRLK